MTPPVHTAPAGHPVTAHAVIADQSRRWLLVRPPTGAWWQLPGGLVEPRESPRAACAREVEEETGLQVTVGDLVVVAWIAPRRPARRHRLAFVFRASTTAEPGPMVLQAGEVACAQWVDQHRALQLVHPLLAIRVEAGLRGSRYVEQTRDEPP